MRAKGIVKEEELDMESSMTHPVLLDKDDDSHLPQEMRLSSVVKFDWKDPKKSQILGKHYKPNFHFRPPSLRPVVNIDEDFGQVGVPGCSCQ